MEKEINKWEEEFRKFFKKQFDVSSWPQITDNTIKQIEEIRQEAIEEVLRECIGNEKDINKSTGGF